MKARARAAYDLKSYRECVGAFAEAARLAGGELAGDAYDAACCASLDRQVDGAFRLLQRAVDLGYRDVEHLRKDADLLPLHADPRWESLVAAASAKQEIYLKSVNAELFRLYQEDQGDRVGDFKRLQWKILNERDAQRRDRVRQLLREGALKVSDDYFHAAMVFQHGTVVPDYQLAHALALRAVEMDPNNKTALWLAAAAKDRELMNLGKPQRYGTQFRVEKGRWFLYRVDPTVTDDERAKWNVPPLEMAKKRAEAMNQAQH